jgi:hypothetical protein
MIKRFLKIILFIPFIILSGIQLPFCILWYLFKGDFPQPLLGYLIDWD